MKKQSTKHEESKQSIDPLMQQELDEVKEDVEELMEGFHELREMIKKNDSKVFLTKILDHKSETEA